MPSRRVLVVEDNLDIAMSLVKLCQIDGHVTQHAADGEVALALALRFRPEVVILDIGLPGIDGYEVCRRLKADTDFACTRFIAVSGYHTEEDRARSKAVGCEAHLAKPADPRQLLALVGK